MTSEMQSDEIDKITASGFLFKIWEERLFVFMSVLFFAFLAEGYILLSSPKYTASILVGHVTPVDNVSQSAGSSAAGTIALLGLGAAPNNDKKFTLFLTLIKTETFARLLEQKYHYVERTRGSTKIRDVNSLAGLLKSIIVVPSPDEETTTLSLQASDREFARNFLLTVYREGNQAVQQIDTQRAQKFASFIENRFKSENNRAMQDALGSLLVAQERFLMVTSVNLPYAAQLLDVTVSATPTSPKKKLLLLIGLAVGFSMGTFGILIADAFGTERRKRGLETLGPSKTIISICARAKRRLMGTFGSRGQSRPRHQRV